MDGVRKLLKHRVRKLTYPGDRTASVGQILGPDMFGGMWKIVYASYSDGKTTVRLNPYVPS